MQKAEEKHFKEKAAEYYAQNKEAIKEKSTEPFKYLSQEKKRARLRRIKGKNIKNWFNIMKDALKNN